MRRGYKCEGKKGKKNKKGEGKILFILRNPN
jgi:hypothetical protein